MVKLALCVITKGDEELTKLKRAVVGVAPYVQTVHITTNAKDYKQTEEWCHTMGYNHSHLPWNKDFSEQRNFNFSQAPKDVDYVVWMDSDDVVDGAEHLPRIAENAKKQELDTVFFDYWYGNRFNGEPSLQTFQKVEVRQNRERLINPRKIIWKGRLHETPVPKDDNEVEYSYVHYTKENPVVWVHLDMYQNMSDEQKQARMDRNREILELQLADERQAGNTDPRTLLYLMKIYAESNKKEDWLECLEMGKEYLSKSGWDAERAVCASLMARCMGYLGRDRQSRDLLMEAIKEHPYDPILYLYLAKSCFNLNDYGAMKHWMRIGLSLEVDDKRVAMQNLLELETLGAELMLRYYMNAERNPEKAYGAAKTLYELLPTPQNKENMDYLENQKELNRASRNLHELILYYENTAQESLIPKLIKNSPQSVQELPFAQHFYNKYKKPRVWGDKEICYYATFNSPHFEKWDGNSLQKGIGGSETAVIRLSEEWTKLGYKVTVYCDPTSETEINGVRYVPYYKFNHRDRFNILITWRHANLAGKVNAKKHYVDLHDLYGQDSYIKKANNIDAFMVKSKYHANLAPDIKNKEVISNGI